jgi:hypothetical protein
LEKFAGALQRKQGRVKDNKSEARNITSKRKNNLIS